MHDATPVAAQRVVAIYLRGNAQSRDRQRGECEALAARHEDTSFLSWYADTEEAADRSARDRLMADLEAGRIAAVITYDLSRLGRTAAELERLVRLSTSGPAVPIRAVLGDVDLSTVHGRITARMYALVAEEEAAAARAAAARARSARARAASRRRREGGGPRG